MVLKKLLLKIFHTYKSTVSRPNLSFPLELKKLMTPKTHTRKNKGDGQTAENTQIKQPANSFL